MAFTLRQVVGRALTHVELDNNFISPSYGNFGSATGATTGEIRASSNITAYTSSDIRLKENIKPIENALQIVLEVGGKTFDWNKTYIDKHNGEDGYYIRKHDFGVIAQDLLKTFPIAVRTREDGTFAVDYEKLVAVAFQAIIELTEKVKALEAKNKE